MENVQGIDTESVLELVKEFWPDETELLNDDDLIVDLINSKAMDSNISSGRKADLGTIIEILKNGSEFVVAILTSITLLRSLLKREPTDEEIKNDLKRNRKALKSATDDLVDTLIRAAKTKRRKSK